MPLSYWLDRLPGFHSEGRWGSEVPRFVYSAVEGDEATVRKRIAEVDRKSTEAIVAIGMNGVDVLLRRLKKRDSHIKRFARHWGARLRVVNLEKVLAAEQRRGQAIEGFHRLGAIALPVLPELVQLSHDPDPAIRSAATFAIGGVAPNDWRELINEKGNPLRVKE